MSDSAIHKVEADHSAKGQMGQTYLAAGKSISMRLWDNEQPGDAKPAVARDYETVGYVLSGRAELTVEGETTLLAAGDSWVVPQGASHTYAILEAFTAVEATHPPAQAQGRDQNSR